MLAWRAEGPRSPEARILIAMANEMFGENTLQWVNGQTNLHVNRAGAGMISESELGALVDEAGYADWEIIAVAVVNGDGTIVRQARGILPDGRRMSAAMQVYGASLTKQIVTMCAAQLVKSGQLDPDLPISAWLPELPEWGSRIRFRHLVHHLSGLPLEETLLARMDELSLNRRTSEAMLEGVATFPELIAEPGETHQYSNIGYVMMGRIIEIITGSPLIEYIDSEVFQPLGMTQSRLWQGPERNPDGANPLDPQKPIPHSLGDGGMWTTADDFTRWIGAMNADVFGVRELMMTTTTLNDGTPLDYAWGIAVSRENEVEICSHGGGWYGSVSKSLWIPSLTAGFIAFTVTGGDALDVLSANLRKRLTAS
ncbi:serine hydrolase [soil metagenome]